MAKVRKKRNKVYQGADAKQPTDTGPVIHRYEAVDRGRFGEWWYTRKRFVRPIAIGTGITALVVWLIYEMFRIVL